MISPEVGIRFSLKYHHINWPTDCPLGFLTTFYLFTLQYFFHHFVHQLLDSISAALFVSGR